MAKVQLTPEQYKEKSERKAAKRKSFAKFFMGAIAFFVAIVVVYSATSMAYTKIGFASMVRYPSNNGANSNNSVNTDNSTNNGWGDNSTNTDAPSTDSNETPSGDNTPSTDSNSGSDILSSKSMQFDMFVKAFKGVKTNAKSATLLKKNAYNYNNHVEAGMLSSLGKTLMSNFLKEEEVNTTYTGADIAGNFPPSGATCGLTKEDIKSIECKEEGNYYVITVVVKGAVNPTAGEKVGAVASVLTKQSIQDPIKDVPVINSIEPKCDYKDATAIAKIDKATGNMVEYYFDLPMILFMDSYEIGLGFEEWWTVAYLS